MLREDYVKIKEKNLQMLDINEFNENLDFRRMVNEILIYIYIYIYVKGRKFYEKISQSSFKIIVETMLQEDYMKIKEKNLQMNL